MSGHRFDSIEQLVGCLRSGEVTPSEVLADTFAAIDRLNPLLNALTATWHGDAGQRAADIERAPSREGALWGVPSADKDLVDRSGYATRRGSRATALWPVADSSDPMATWLDSTGAISVGKSATPEFGLTSYTESDAFGATRNPHNLDLGAGGSSGGAAAAVASGMLPFAPGSDGGGSVRIPALACGVVGLKPSRGRIPAHSGFESVSGLVVPGIIARTVADVSYVSDALFAGDYRWSTAAPPLSSTLADALMVDSGPLRIGVTTDTPWANDVECPLDPEADLALKNAVAALEDAGHTVVEWAWSPLPGYFDAFSLMWQASTTGVTFRDEERDMLEPLTRFLVDAGGRVSGAHLVHTVAWLRRFEHHTISALSGFDAVLTPGLATTPPPVGWYHATDAQENFLQQIRVTPYTSFVNVCGLPALALPTHYTGEGSPMGVQLVGPPGREDTLVLLGQHIETRVAATSWPSVSVVTEG